MELSPIKARLEGKPILVDVKNNLENRHRDDKESRLSTGCVLSPCLSLEWRPYIGWIVEDQSCPMNSPQTFSNSAK